jgi:hypothetical protein
MENTWQAIRPCSSGEYQKAVIISSKQSDWWRTSSQVKDAISRLEVKEHVKERTDAAQFIRYGQIGNQGVDRWDDCGPRRIKFVNVVLCAAHVGSTTVAQFPSLCYPLMFVTPRPRRLHLASRAFATHHSQLASS